MHAHARAQVINQVGAVSLHATLNCDAFATEHSGESHYDRNSFVGLAWRPPRESICCGARHSLARASTGRADTRGVCAQRSTQLVEQSKPLRHCTASRHRHLARNARSLPGSVTERQLLDSFSRMLPELRTPPPPSLHACQTLAKGRVACAVRFSSASQLLATIPIEQQAHHRVVRDSANDSDARDGDSHGTRDTACVGRAQKHLANLGARSKPMLPEPVPAKSTSIWDGWGDAVSLDRSVADVPRSVERAPVDDDSADDADDDFDLAALGL